MLGLIRNHPFAKGITILYAFVVLWWLKINFVSHSQDSLEAYLYNFVYGFIPLAAGIFSATIAQTKWNGVHSVLGKGLVGITVGLLCQWGGLMVWTFYNVILGVQAPYPSIADFGYFALIPAYTFAAYSFAHASGAKYSLKSFDDFMYVFLLPLLFLFIAYLLFIHGAKLNTSNFLTTFLNFGYPLGEIVPLSISVFIVHLSSTTLGGVMRKNILFLAVAFIAQFVAEYVFIYRNAMGLYVNGGISDLLYPTAYFIMALAVVAFATIDEHFNKA